MQNNSVPVGSTNWFQGNATVFVAQSGATTSYIGANFNNTTGANTISNWLLTPNRTYRNGDVFSFYTRCVVDNLYPDRLEVRLSTNGASTNVGTGSAAVGDFTTVLLTINPTLVTSGYPFTAFQQYTITVSGLAAPTSGRIAFRYFVTNGGPSGANSDYIGIDNVVYTPYVCPTLTVTPASLTGGTAGTAYSQTLSQTGALGVPAYVVTAGALPPGLTLSTGGTISGTPTATGTFNFTVTVADASGCTGSIAYSITIVRPTGGAALAVSPAAVCSNAGIISISGGSPAGGVYSGTGVAGTTFDPAAGTQTLTYTLVDAYGCTQVANNAITVNAAPTVAANSTATAVCAGTAVTLTGAGADTYVWDNSVVNGVAFTPAATTTYMVTGTTTATGCTSTSTVAVTVNTNPTVAANSTAAAVCPGGSVTLTGAGADTYSWDNSVVDGAAFAPTGTTVYTVTGTTTATGCTSTATVTVTVNPNPTVTASSTATLNAVCTGGTVSLMGAGADTYSWDNSVLDATPFTPTATTVYTVTGTTTATGCTSTSTITITVNSNPVVDFTLPVALVCETAGIFTLTGESPAGGTFSGTSVTGNTFDPSVGAGIYPITYTYTDANGCVGTDMQNLTVDLCTGVNNIASLTAVSVYPNPTSNNITIQTAVVADMIIVTDVVGKTISETVPSDVTAVISLAGVNNGIYFVKVISNGQTKTVRVVKSK
jgi:hypothetical protein